MSRLSTFASVCVRHARAVCVVGLLLAVGAGVLASQRLGVSTDVDQLFNANLPWKRNLAAFDAAFPQFNDLLVVVIDADIPEAADVTAADLAAALDADRTHFVDVRRPDALPFFATSGFLLLDTPDLADLLDRTIDAQPFLGQLSTDPSARGVLSALSLLGMGVEQGQADLTPFAAALNGFHETLAGAASGHARPLSWARLLGGSVADKAGKYHFVLAHPKLDYGALQPGGAASDAIRAAAAKLEFVRDGTARVRITGSVALADEEFATVAQGAVAGLVGSGVLVVLWLFLAVRSWRLIVPIVATLVLGLMLTTGFATLAVGTLNLISVAFAILFIGIAVDFAIQFSVRLREMRLQNSDLGAALSATSRRVGIQILVAAAATAAGFLAFVPTDFSGVAELGLIAGVGMLIALICTLTFLPAMLALCRPRREAREIGFVQARPLDRMIARARVPILAVFAVLTILGIALTTQLRFDADPLHTKDPSTEAMRTLRDLMQDPLTNPYTIDTLMPNVEEAAKLADRLDKLPLVAHALSLASFVPTDQQAKLALIADASNLLGPTLAQHAPAASVTAGDLRLAVQTALGQLEPALAKLPPGAPLAAIVADLRALRAGDDTRLIAADRALTRFLPLQLDRLRLGLSAQRVTLANLPEDLARDWRLPDGRTRVQVLAKPEAQDSAGLRAFVRQISAVAPQAGGAAVSIVATSETIINAFEQAAASAVVAISLILFLVLRRILDVALVLAPLLLSGLLTVILAVALPLPLNFANVIALPLLLGVGVSFNIYFVMNWRIGEKSRLASPTARAVIFSALTTGTAFGSLALSRHPGTASMGELLLLSLGCTLVATLVFIPALLAGLTPHEAPVRSAHPVRADQP